MEELPSIAPQHARTSAAYALREKAVAEAVKTCRFTQTEGARETFGSFGEIELPYYRMGAVDSLDLFGLDELIIFSFYWANRLRYRRAADIGANLGLHSILMGKCGWQVRAYEPDPKHAALLKRNLALNQSRTVELVEAAVSDKSGTLEFVRVLGNTTSSHLSGAKSSAYGELEKFPVRVESIAAIMPTVDFVKMDAEGQERTILLATTAADWAKTDMMVEIGSPENAEAIFNHLSSLGVNAFAQKLGWGRVASLADMPISYKGGSLFITRHLAMNW
ncbi:MAG: methyltransferase [Opitutia bacterium Tous-C4FEB]|nr:MAG: methyltransferase [Opitutae bacterium Tous-C4FEB]